MISVRSEAEYGGRTYNVTIESEHEPDNEVFEIKNVTGEVVIANEGDDHDEIRMLLEKSHIAIKAAMGLS